MIGLEISIENDEVTKTNTHLIESVSYYIFQIIDPGYWGRLFVKKYSNDWKKCKLFQDSFTVKYELNHIQEYNDSLPDDMKLILEVESF